MASAETGAGGFREQRLMSHKGPANPEEINRYTSRHTGGGNFVFGDGHVGYLSRSTTYQTYKALSTRSKGEVISNGDY